MRGGRRRLGGSPFTADGGHLPKIHLTQIIDPVREGVKGTVANAPLLGDDKTSLFRRRHIRRGGSHAGRRSSR